MLTAETLLLVTREARVANAMPDTLGLVLTVALALQEHGLQFLELLIQTSACSAALGRGHPL